MRVVIILSCFVATSALDLLDCPSKTGQNVTLTFSFSEDISQNHEINGFSVLRYHHQVLNDIEPVVECIWFRPRNLRCLETPGYELIEPITDTVRIIIKNYTDERLGGIYFCQASPGQQLISKKCKLPPDRTDNQTEISTQTPDIHDTTGQHESEQHEKYIHAVLLDHSTTVLTLLSLVLVAVLVHPAVFLWYLWKHRGVGTAGRNIQPTSNYQNVSMETQPQQNDVELKQRLSKMEEEIKAILDRVYQMTTDTTATLLTHLQNLSAKLDANKSQALEESSKDYEDDTSYKAEVTDSLLNQVHTADRVPQRPECTMIDIRMTNTDVYWGENTHKERRTNMRHKSS